MFPSSNVMSLGIFNFDKRSKISSAGCPKRLLLPAEIIAKSGLTFSSQNKLDDVFEPWCPKSKTSESQVFSCSLQKIKLSL